MKRILCALLLICLAMPVLANPGPADKSDQLELMAKVVNLSPAQQQRLRALTETMRKELTAWQTKNQPKADRLNAEMKAAVAAKDEAKGRAVREQMLAMMRERNALIERYGGEMMKVLTPAQQQTWTVYILQQNVITRYRPVTFSAAQEKRLKEMCTAAVVNMKKLPEDDIKGRMAVQAQLHKDVEEKVLTQAQRNQLKAEAEKMKALREQQQNRTAK